MTTHQVFVKNIRCDSSINMLKACLMKAEGVTGLNILKNEQLIEINGDAVIPNQIVDILHAHGYAEIPGTGVYSKKNSFDYWYCHCCGSCD